MAAQLRMSLADVTIVVLLLLGLPRRVLSSPDGFDGEVHPPFNVSEGEVQDKDTLCPLVELPVAYNGQVQAYSIWPSDEDIQVAMRSVSLTLCLQNSVGLDRDTRASYSFILTATEADSTGSDSINITLRLLDINDNSPSFLDSTTSTSYTIPENAAVHDSVGPGPIVAEDPDEGVNGTVRYQLEGCSDVFQIHNTSGLITLKASSLDREMKDTYSCMVTASDMAVHNPRSASWEFDIVISDVNDNAPHCFDGQDKHSLNITENASSFVVFVCEDADKGSNGTVNTTVILANTTLSNNISVMYRPEFRAYVLIIKSLDREALGPGEDRYIIQLNVSDEGSPPQITPLFVTVFVEDVNDTPPQFEGPSLFYVSEDHVADQPVGKVHFTDPDLHSTLHYSLRQAMRGKEDIRLSANISIANNGNIFVSNSSFLDFESPLPPLIILTVDVTDGLHTTNANVTLNITDVNDNIPEFESSAYSFDVVENVATGTPVGNVTAQDADSGNYGAIRYTIRTMGAPFMISETSGVITTSGPIDSERIDSYSIEVMAEDRGTLERDVVAQVNITVRDEDDNCPIFLDKDYVIEWYQDGMKVPFGVKATDADSDAFNTVRYSLNRVIEFEIDENSGIVSLRDSEQKNVNTTLKVTAEANVEGGSTNCEPVEATLVIIFYGVQRPTASPTESPKTLTVITIVCSVLGEVVLCVVVAVFAIVVSCVCIRRHSKTYNVNNFSPTESPLEKVTIARTKSTSKSYSSDGADGKQKNSCQFKQL